MEDNIFKNCTRNWALGVNAFTYCLTVYITLTIQTCHYASVSIKDMLLTTRSVILLFLAHKTWVNRAAPCFMEGLQILKLIRLPSACCSQQREIIKVHVF